MDPPTLRSGLTRRRALALGTVGCCACLAKAGPSDWLRRLLGTDAVDDATAAIFKGDAPDDRTWDLWRRRGWVREAAHYLKLGANVQCKICPNNCLLAPGDRSHCRNRVNRDGTLYTLAYANPCTFHVDPVEKKPLFHYLPGSRTFSLATAGCVFRCLNCQNWEISQKKPEETKDATGPELRLRAPLPERLSYEDMRRLSLFPEDLPGVASALRCPSVSYTYSEPTAYYEYAKDCCAAVRARGLRNILVTCGSVESRALADLAPLVDAAHIDLKGFDDAVYRTLNSGRLQPILDTLEAYRDRGIWFEVIHLVVPTYTDKEDTLKRLCDWFAAKLGPDRPLHFSRFHPQHRLEHLPPTPVEILVKARDIAKASGLRYVYIGNVRGVPDAETTFCPQCRRPVIEREGFAIRRVAVDEGRCRHCRTPIAGVWA